jgi:hypothetical protein
MGILSDPVSSVVAPTCLRWGIFFCGVATAAAEGKLKVAHYRLPDTMPVVPGSGCLNTIGLPRLGQKAAAPPGLWNQRVYPLMAVWKLPVD